MGFGLIWFLLFFVNFLKDNYEGPLSLESGLLGNFDSEKFCIAISHFKTNIG